MISSKDLNKIILPKLLLEAIPGIWDAKDIPDDLPESNSIFSTKYTSEETKQAVYDMESKLNTEESIITADMVTDYTRIGNYLGTYDVVAVAGEETLLSPKSVSDADIDVIAMHYNEETKTWEKVEDAHIVDNYVYGTLTQFSPIAVFTIRKDTYFDENCEKFNMPSYICNGIPVVVTTDDEGKIIVTDANGKVTEITNTTQIVGGSIDGTNLKSTSITVVNSEIYGIRAGSISEDNIVTIEKSKVNITGSTVKNGITGGCYNCRMENIEFNIKDSTTNFLGVGESYWAVKKKDSNKMANIGLGSNAYVKKATVNAENLTCNLLFAGGNSGYLYVDETYLNITGGNYKYLLLCGSNGKTNKCVANINGSELKYFQTANRGIVNYAKSIIKNTNIDYCFIAGDSTDKTVTGTIDRVNLDITGGNINLYAGVNGGVQVTSEVTKEIIERLTISRSTNLIYGEDNGESLLKDYIRIK